MKVDYGKLKRYSKISKASTKKQKQTNKQKQSPQLGIDVISIRDIKWSNKNILSKECWIGEKMEQKLSGAHKI